MTVACPRPRPLHLALSGDPASHTADNPTSTQQKSSAHNFGEALILPLPDTGRPPSGEEAIPGSSSATGAMTAEGGRAACMIGSASTLGVIMSSWTLIRLSPA
jgi:hypothetical protein